MLCLQVKFLQNHVSGNGCSDLEKKGIMQLNSVFGNELEKIRKFGGFDPKCQGMEKELPEFLVRAIRKIESLKPWSAGLYRVRLELMWKDPSCSLALPIGMEGIG